MSTVNAIFDRAERCFENRVAQLLQEKRSKAEETGAPLNPRKAKRDARTAAGREKLDGLVRRLADLALVQEKIIATHCKNPNIVRQTIDGATCLWLSAAAATLAAYEKENSAHPEQHQQQEQQQEQQIQQQLLQHQPQEEQQQCMSTAATNALSSAIVHHQRTVTGQQSTDCTDDTMFDATKSVVQFVLGPDADNDICTGVLSQSPRSIQLSQMIADSVPVSHVLHRGFPYAAGAPFDVAHSEAGPPATDM